MPTTTYQSSRPVLIDQMILFGRGTPFKHLQLKVVTKPQLTMEPVISRPPVPNPFKPKQLKSVVLQRSITVKPAPPKRAKSLLRRSKTKA